MNEKPPLGLMQENLYKEKSNSDRMKGILYAMLRYVEAGKEVPGDWIEELSRRSKSDIIKVVDVINMTLQSQFNSYCNGLGHHPNCSFRTFEYLCKWWRIMFDGDDIVFGQDPSPYDHEEVLIFQGHCSDVVLFKNMTEVYRGMGVVIDVSLLRNTD